MVAFGRKQQRRLIAFCVAGGAAALGLAVLVNASGSLLMFLMGSFVFIEATFGYYIWSWHFVITAISSAQASNMAYQHLTKGEHTEAEEMFKSIEDPPPYVRMAIEGHRARLAMARGDLASVKVHATNVLAQPTQLISRAHQKPHRASAHSFLALGAAFDTNEAEVAKNAQAVRNVLVATPESLARAAVAECVLVWKRQDRQTLTRLLRENARVLWFALPRERVLVRAMSRYVSMDGSSVYREPAERYEGDTTGLEWINAIAPDAAPYAPVTGYKSRATMRAALETLHQAALPAAEPHQTFTRVQKLAFAGLVVCTGGLGIAYACLAFVRSFASLSWEREQFFDRFFLAVLSVAIVLFLLLVAIRVFKTRSEARDTRNLSRAIRLRIEGDQRGAIAKLAKIADSPNWVAYPLAASHLADELEMQGEWVDAMATVTKAISRVAKNELARGASADIVLPELIRKRSFLCAVSNHLDDALADLALLRRDFPAYPYLPIATFETELVAFLRRGDLEQARALVKSRTLDLGIRPNVQLLCDWVLAKTGDLSRRDVRLLEAETDRDANVRRWLDVVGPGLVASSSSSPPAIADVTAGTPC